MQISPTELECVILRHPVVHDVGVVAIPDERFGEVPKAFIVRNNSTLCVDQVHRIAEGKIPLSVLPLHYRDSMSYSSENLAAYKRLRGGIEFVDVIPRTASAGKLRRNVLEEMTGF